MLWSPFQSQLDGRLVKSNTLFKWKGIERFRFVGAIFRWSFLKRAQQKYWSIVKNDEIQFVDWSELLKYSNM